MAHPAKLLHNGMGYGSQVTRHAALQMALAQPHVRPSFGRARSRKLRPSAPSRMVSTQGWF